MKHEPNFGESTRVAADFAYRSSRDFLKACIAEYERVRPIQDVIIMAEAMELPPRRVGGCGGSW